MDWSPRAPVVVLAYDGVAADETSVVVQILASADLNVIVSSVGARPVTSFHGRVIPTGAVEELRQCSALIVPGGMGVLTAAENPRLTSAVQMLAGSATWLRAT